jgi:hypothetical protein
MAVLITGASGHIRFRTLAFLLHYSYEAKVVLEAHPKSARSATMLPSKLWMWCVATLCLSLRILTHISQEPEALTFVEVSDMTIPGCFDEVVQNVSFIVHVAAPLTSRPTLIPAIPISRPR